MKIKKLFLSLTFIFFIIFSNTYINISSAAEAPSIDTGSIYLMDSRTTKPLYTKDENTRMYPASTTKIMTAILTLENCDLDEVVTANYSALSNIPEGYTTADIQIGEQLTIEQLLELLLVHSANDAANVLAEYVGGSIDSFVSMMNTKLNDLGLTDSHFTNAYGLQDDNHYTTAHDLAFLMKYCLQNETFRKISGQASCAIPATNMWGPRKYDSTNQLLIAGNEYYYQYVFSGKTGFTSQAKHCLVTAAYNNNLELICVVLGGTVVNGVPTRFSESKALYEYGFNNFSLKNIANPGEIITEIEIPNGSPDTKSLDLAFTDTIYALVNNTDLETNYTPEIHLNENISAPITQGDVLGNVTYIIDGIQYTSDIVATHNVEASQLLQFVLQIGGLLVVLLITFKIFFSSKKEKNN